MRTDDLTPNQLQSSKVVENIHFILRSYGVDNWSPEYKSDLKHDIAVKLDYADIKRVSIELLAADNTILYAHHEEFQQAVAAAVSTNHPMDSARGLELPVIPRNMVQTYRLLTSGAAREREYRHLLRMNWSPAEKLQERAGAAFDGEHTSAMTGGRTKATVFVSNEARQAGTLIRLGSKGFGFLRDDCLGDVFVHPNFCAPGTALIPGHRYGYIVIQTPRGLQARDVKMAA